MHENQTTALPLNQKLSEALAKAQGEIEAAKKSEENKHFSTAQKKASYADIADVIEVIKGPASKNGLSVTFNYKTTFAPTPIHMIQYILRHSSGEIFVSDWIMMLMRGSTQHDFGSSNTYYRRQLLKAIYQIPEEDDDGNDQSKPSENKSKPAAQNTSKPNNVLKNTTAGELRTPTTPKPEEKKDPSLREQLENRPDPSELDQALESQTMGEETLMDQLLRLVREKGLKPAEVTDIIFKATNLRKKSTELPAEELEKVVKFITAFK